MQGRKIFEGTVLNTATQYVPLTVFKRALGATIGWKDATSSATITLEFTDDNVVANDAAGDVWQWLDSGETIVGPVASAAGGTLLSLENKNHRRGRIKIVAAANCEFVIWDYAGEEY